MRGHDPLAEAGCYFCVRIHELRKRARLSFLLIQVLDSLHRTERGLFVLEVRTLDETTR